MKLRSMDDFLNYQVSLKGNPRINVVEYFGGITIKIHRQDKRKIKPKILRKYLPAAIVFNIKLVPHSEMKKGCHFHWEHRPFHEWHPLIERKYPSLGTII